jgi:hypothetical protein
MANTFTQGKATDGGQASAPTLAYTSNVTSGHLLLAYCNEFAVPTTPAFTVTDSRSNTWTRVDAIHKTADESLALFWAISKDSGACTVTFHLDSTTYYGLIIAEFATTGTPAVDGTNHGTEEHFVSGSATFTSTSFTPTAGDLLIAVYSDDQASETLTPASPWVDQLTIKSTTGTGDNCAMEYQLSASGSATAGGWTSSPNFAGGGASLWVAFTPGGGGATDPFPAGYGQLQSQMLHAIFYVPTMR